MQSKVVLVNPRGKYSIISVDNEITSDFLDATIQGSAGETGVNEFSRGRDFLKSIDATVIIDASIRSKYFEINAVNIDIFGSFILVKADSSSPTGYTGFSDDEIHGIIENLGLVNFV